MAHILVAEDETPVRTFVCRALELKGHTTHPVPDGGAAVDALEKGDYDLLLTDIVMPVMNGIALALKASSTKPAMPILMMTGYAHEKQRAHNMESLIHDVISKPFSLDELCAAVETVLNRDDAS